MEVKNYQQNHSARKNVSAWLIAVTLVLTSFSTVAQAQASASACDRACITKIVDQLLASMVAHDPDTLPLAPMYEATENSHPSSLAFMTAWRTITEAGKPDFLAIDTKAGSAFILTTVSESGSKTVLWGRIKVENQKISEIEIFLNRSRGDHGFSFSADQLPTNVKHWMNPPADRKKATREELEQISRAAFDAKVNLTLDSAPDCQFLEAGTLVIDPGVDDNSANFEEAKKAGKTNALGCMFPPFRPSDPKAREVVIDEELGVVVNAAMIPGIVYPYPLYRHGVSAFIPSDMAFAAKAQDAWIAKIQKEGKLPILKPTLTMGDCMQILQFYNGKLEGSSINVYLGGPEEKSVWVK
jgi:hypothetical protein